MPIHLTTSPLRFQSTGQHCQQFVLAEAKVAVTLQWFEPHWTPDTHQSLSITSPIQLDKEKK